MEYHLLGEKKDVFIVRLPIFQKCIVFVSLVNVSVVVCVSALVFQLAA